MAERGISLAHTTILRWVQHYLPEFENRWKRYARAFGGSWRMDETYIKVRGQWVYLYRAVDKSGGTIIGIELAEKIKKGQFKTGKLGGPKASMSELWNAALAA